MMAPEDVGRERPDECDFCSWPTTELHEAPQPTYLGNGHPMEATVGGWLCTVCYSTHASNVFHYPTSYPGVSVSLSVTCWGINYLASLGRGTPSARDALDKVAAVLGGKLQPPYNTYEITARVLDVLNWPTH